MPNMWRLLENKVCLITGASRGIGKAVAEQFASDGAIVYANARKEGSIDLWAEECSIRYNTKLIPVYFDVTNSPSVKKVLMRIKKDQGKLDVLVNNAGVASNERIGMISREKMGELFNVNVFSVIELLQWSARIMMKQKGGVIINISSIAGTNGARGMLLYSGTKGAVIAITKSAAKELAPYNIRVNSIAPGLTGTDRFREMLSGHLDENIAKIGLGKLATPNDIAYACAFLASERASYISGEILGVNGCTIL